MKRNKERHNAGKQIAHKHMVWSRYESPSYIRASEQVSALNRCLYSAHSLPSSWLASFPPLLSALLVANVGAGERADEEGEDGEGGGCSLAAMRASSACDASKCGLQCVRTQRSHRCTRGTGERREWHSTGPRSWGTNHSTTAEWGWGKDV